MQGLSIGITFVACVAIIFQIIFILVKDPRDQVMRYFAYYCFTAFGILSTMLLTYAYPYYFDLTLLNKITQFATLMTFSALFIISFVFPKREKKFPFWITVLVLLPPLVLGIIVVSTDFTITSA